MKILNSILAIIILLFSACSQKPVPDYSEVEKEINNLTSFEDKKSYLEAIYKDDHRVRNAQKSTDLIKK